MNHWLFIHILHKTFLFIGLFICSQYTVSISREWTMSNFFTKKKVEKIFQNFLKKIFKKKKFKKFRKISGKQTNSKFLKFFWRYYQLQCLSYFLNFFSSNLDEIWLLCDNLKKVRIRTFVTPLIIIFYSSNLSLCVTFSSSLQHKL